MIDRWRRAGRWFFTDPDTDTIVIAQAPNATLTGFIVAKATEFVLDGTPESIAGWTATAFLVVWAGDEIIRGVNPWRRTLGAVVLLWQLWSRLA